MFTRNCFYLTVLMLMGITSFSTIASGAIVESLHVNHNVSKSGFTLTVKGVTAEPCQDLQLTPDGTVGFEKDEIKLNLIAINPSEPELCRELGLFSSTIPLPTLAPGFYDFVIVHEGQEIYRTYYELPFDAQPYWRDLINPQTFGGS